MIDTLFEGIRQGDIAALSRGITLVESRRADHQEMAAELVNRCLPYTGHAVRIGITGVPGVGKSTFIEAFGLYLLEEQKSKLAVLAIDPSSQRSKGAILGDKTRMNLLAADTRAYIRPSASGSTLGGVQAQTRQASLLCEAAGYNIILIETVGVGQSETAVQGMVDFFLLLMLAGAGDELQGIKRGIMEMADAVVINKAEGDNYKAASRAAADYRQALHLFPPSPSGWLPEVKLCSALEKTGIAEIWEMIERYCRHTRTNGYWEHNRREQRRNSLDEALHRLIERVLHQNPELKTEWSSFEQAVMDGKMSSEVAALALWQKVKGI